VNASRAIARAPGGGFVVQSLYGSDGVACGPVFPRCQSDTTEGLWIRERRSKLILAKKESPSTHESS
jgi:hypothetical protein